MTFFWQNMEPFLQGLGRKLTLAALIGRSRLGILVSRDTPLSLLTNPLSS